MNSEINEIIENLHLNGKFTNMTGTLSCSPLLSILLMNSTILSIMNHCFPFKKFTMSSRDPYWMTPVIKILLKKRSNLLARG